MNWNEFSKLEFLKIALKFICFDAFKLFYAICALIKAERLQSLPFPLVTDVGKRSGQVAVITGGPRGLALQLVKKLLEMDYTVVIGARNVDDSWRRLSPLRNSGQLLGNVKIYKMDLKSFNSVQNFANKVKENHNRIDLLFCNAANMDKPGTLTGDGIESQIQVNYLSGFLLVQLFKDRMKETSELKGSPCQIIFTSSLLYEAGRVNLEFQKPEMLTATRLYYTTKLFQVTAMMALEERFQNEGTSIHCYCVHPGVIPTDMWTNNSFIGRMAKKLQKYFKTADSGADEILRPVVCPKLQISGGFFLVNGKSRKLSFEASNKDNQRLAYEKSMKEPQDSLPVLPEKIVGTCFGYFKYDANIINPGLVLLLGTGVTSFMRNYIGDSLNPGVIFHEVQSHH